MEFKTAIAIRDAIGAGKITAVEVTQYYLDKIAEKDPDVKAFLEVFSDEALAAAKKVDEKKAAGEELGRLAGVPVAIKDMITVQGHVTSGAATILKEHIAAYDATAVARLREQDAIIIGRVNCDDAAMGVTTETSAYHKTHNPHDLERIPGGSSGGSAAAVAAGMVPVSLGTDTGGSIRQPAAMCGVTGIKPSYGRVSRYGSLALCSSFDQIGPFATTVEDAALVLEVIEGKDPMDATTVDAEGTNVAELLTGSFEGMRFGLPKEYFTDGMDERVEKAVKDVVKLIEENGGEVKEVSLAMTEYGMPTYYILLPAEVSSNLARYDGLRYGTRPEQLNLHETYLKAKGDGFGEEVKRRIMIGTYTLSAGYYDAYYKKALQVRQAIKMDFDKAFQDVDLIITPTAPTIAWKLGEVTNPIDLYLADIFTCPANVAGIAGISLPCGEADGMPIGFQFLANAFEEGKMLQAGHAYQQLTDWHKRFAL